MNFDICSADQIPVSNKELNELLWQVYVDEGYTPSVLAKVIFEPASVRQRGILFIARDKLDHSVAGMIILVPPTSKARVIAEADECEMHLLGVKSEFRGFGLGRKLVETILIHAKKNNWPKMLLWTQKNMIAAHKLYESCGFNRVGELSKDGIDFFVYERIET